LLILLILPVSTGFYPLLPASVPHRRVAPSPSSHGRHAIWFHARAPRKRP